MQVHDECDLVIGRFRLHRL